MSRARRLFVDLTAEEAAAALAGTLRSLTRPVSRETSLVDGAPAEPHVWDRLVLASPLVRVDPGPSPSGNPGPYLHVPHRGSSEWSRVYPLWQPDAVLFCREAWGFCYTGSEQDLAFFATPEDRKRAGGARARKPSTLPAWGCRSAVRVVANTVERTALGWDWYTTVERAEVPR